jgi:hypothetical protein
MNTEEGEKNKQIVFGLCITLEDEYLVYDESLNLSLSRREVIPKGDDRRAVGDGSWVSFVPKTRYAALCMGEPDGLKYVQLESITTETIHDFDILAQKKEGRAGIGNENYYESPYCEAVIIDTKTFKAFHSTDDCNEDAEFGRLSTNEQEEMVRKIVEKYVWCDPDAFHF